MKDSRQTVMLVDDSVTSLGFSTRVLNAHYNVVAAKSGDELFLLLETVLPDVILLDVEMPGMTGYDVIKVLKADERYAAIPVIFLTTLNDVQNELAGLSLGAVDYLFKPTPPPLLLKRVESQLLMSLQKRQLEDYNSNLQKMVEEKTRTVLELQNAVFDILTEVVEYRDDETGGHVDRTKYFFQVMADSLLERNLYTDIIRAWDMRLVVLSSQMHDIGKVAIRDSILLKPGRLTTEEFEEMKKHTTYGASILERIERNTQERKFIEHAKSMALSHHEKWDGSGYPAGLSGESIPLEGRIMALVDVYDALISSRPYKKPVPHEIAVELIRISAGKHFDPLLVDTFLEVAAKFETLPAFSRKCEACIQLPLMPADS